MRRIAIVFGLGALVFAFAAGAVAPASAASARSSNVGSLETHEFSAQAPRPHITVQPRVTQPGPNSKRYCRSWLAQEYRVSGTVIVPRMQCWWQ